MIPFIFSAIMLGLSNNSYLLKWGYKLLGLATNKYFLAFHLIVHWSYNYRFILIQQEIVCVMIILWAVLTIALSIIFYLVQLSNAGWAIIISGR